MGMGISVPVCGSNVLQLLIEINSAGKAIMDVVVSYWQELRDPNIRGLIFLFLSRLADE